MRAAGLLLAILVPVTGCGGGDPADLERRGEVEIQAHRGGPLETVDGVQVARHPENSMSAFRRAHADGFVIELDVKVTADGVPVVVHDADLDRTTDCSGPVAERTAAELADCRLDRLGTGETTRPNRDPEPVPRLDEVLDWAVGEGARLNLEVKNLPSNADFDAGRGFVRRVLDVLAQSGIAPEQATIQSFWPPNLDEAAEAGWPTVLLTSSERNRAGPRIARQRGYGGISPEWPLPGGLATETAGLRVLPWTLNAESEIRAALAAGVDGIVSDDPGLVRAVAAER